MAGVVTFHSGKDEPMRPRSSERQQQLAEFVVLEGASARGHLLSISGEPEGARHCQAQSPRKLVARFRSLVPWLAALIGISASPVLGMTLAYADEGRLVMIASAQFQNLTVAERR